MFIPDWLKYFAGYFLETRFRGIKKPLLAGFKLTHKCNLSCLHCPFWRREESRTLSFAQVQVILQSLYQKGIRIIIFEGGEPFLWRDGDYKIQHIIAEARKLFFSVGITTNGTFPIEVPAHTVWVSFDGLAKTHNYVRGKPIFEKVIDNIRASSHPNIYANLTINRLNAEEIPELVKFLSGLVRGITIQFHYPYTKADKLTPSPKQRRNVLNELLKLKQAGYPIADSVAAIEALRNNNWYCHDWLLADVDPSGQINMGCYVKNRGEILCDYCGFAAHTEISLAYDLNLEAMLVGHKIFKYSN